MRFSLLIIALFALSLYEPRLENSKSHIAATIMSHVFPVSHNQNQIETLLDNLQQVREGRLHAKFLNDFHEGDERSNLDQIEIWLKQAREQFHFNDAEETQRMKAIDYLGEKLRGRIVCDDKVRVANLLRAHLMDLTKNYDARQKKSLVADQVEIMRYWTLANEREALHMLRSFREQPTYAQLEIGVKNGLWLNGH